jgi:5'-nucleotidase
VALNVNFPNAPTPAMTWAFSRIGTYNLYNLAFRNSPPYGLGGLAGSGMPTPEQAEDESLVIQSKIAVSAMQFGFEHRPAGQQWLRLRLRDLFAE